MESILTYFVAGIFGLAILGKLTGKTKAIFDKAGYNHYFMYGLAFAELVLVIGLFTNYALFSIIGLQFIMLGAIFTLSKQNAKPQQYILSIIAICLLVAAFFNDSNIII